MPLADTTETSDPANACWHLCEAGHLGYDPDRLVVARLRHEESSMFSPPPDHPDDLTRIDREIRLNEAWHEADEMAHERVREEGRWGKEAEKAIETWRDLYA